MGGLILKVNFIVVKFESGFDALDRKLKKNKSWNDPSIIGLIEPEIELKTQPSSSF